LAEHEREETDTHLVWAKASIPKDPTIPRQLSYLHDNYVCLYPATKVCNTIFFV